MWESTVEAGARVTAPVRTLTAVFSRGSGRKESSSAEGREIVCTSTYYSVRAQCVSQYHDIVRVS